MKTYKTVTVSNTHIELLTCDLCGATTSNDEWDRDTYQIDRVEVRYREGDLYPEGGSGTEYEADICPTCFKEKLIPWLESQGCKARWKDWSW